VLSVNRAKDEDVIVSVLSKDELYTLYRFYGARHSTINLGFKIDFEISSSSKSTMSRLRSVLHEGFSWLSDMNRMLVWQQFCRLMYEHLKEAETLDSFYFELLEHASSIWHLQNPKRIAIELYMQLLEHEGRLHLDENCFLCELPLEDDPALVRAFLPTHTSCTFSKPFNKEALSTLFETKSSIVFSDSDIERLYDILCEGF
jgi:hypothetical protein